MISYKIILLLLNWQEILRRCFIVSNMYIYLCTNHSFCFINSYQLPLTLLYLNVSGCFTTRHGNNASSEFIQEDCHLTDIEENVVLACISNVWCKMLAYYTMPVWWILLIKETLNVFRNFLLSFFIIDSTIDLLLYIVFHVLVHLADHPGNIALSHLLNIFSVIKVINYKSF